MHMEFWLKYHIAVSLCTFMSADRNFMYPSLLSILLVLTKKRDLPPAKNQVAYVTILHKLKFHADISHFYSFS